MSIFFNTLKPPNGIDSLIGGRTRIEGNVFFTGELRLEGTVHGNVSALPEERGRLVVGGPARIDGEVAAPRIEVHGTINGQVIAFETLELQSGARVSGDVYYKCIAVRHGAVVEGQLANCATVNPKRAARLKLTAEG